MTLRGNLLFVCTWNQDRSPVGENVFKGYEGVEVKSVGTAIHSEKELLAAIKWADIIFTMELHQLLTICKIAERGGIHLGEFGKPITNLCILTANEEVLKKLIKKRVLPFIERLK